MEELAKSTQQKNSTGKIRIGLQLNRVDLARKDEIQKGGLAANMARGRVEQVLSAEISTCTTAHCLQMHPRCYRAFLYLPISRIYTFRFK
jgi:hypothetical protein